MKRDTNELWHMIRGLERKIDTLTKAASQGPAVFLVWVKSSEWSDDDSLQEICATREIAEQRAKQRMDPDSPAFAYVTGHAVLSGAGTGAGAGAALSAIPPGPRSPRAAAAFRRPLREELFESDALYSGLFPAGVE